MASFPHFIPGNVQPGLRPQFVYDSVIATGFPECAAAGAKAIYEGTPSRESVERSLDSFDSKYKYAAVVVLVTLPIWFPLIFAAATALAILFAIAAFVVIVGCRIYACITGGKSMAQLRMDFNIKWNNVPPPALGGDAHRPLPTRNLERQ